MCTAAPVARVAAVMRACCRAFGGERAACTGAADHVHFPPAVALSRLVNSLKGGSSRRLRQESPDLARHS